jgi:hypothetical protein
MAAYGILVAVVLQLAGLWWTSMENGFVEEKERISKRSEPIVFVLAHFRLSIILRILWGNTRGGSSLLSRTIPMQNWGKRISDSGVWHLSFERKVAFYS